MEKQKRFFEVVSTYKNKDINLPQRQTAYSAGYDFESAEDVVIPSIWKQILKNFYDYLSGSQVTIIPKPTLVHTGIKAHFPKDEVLFLYNRSSNPIKRGLLLANSVGVIDSDYYNNLDNEGEILFAFWNLFPFDIKIKKHDRIGQGIFQKFLTVDDDMAAGERKGGIGSTGN